MLSKHRAKGRIKKLLEFEWLIFNTEISPEKACDNKQINVEIDYSDIVSIDANLTLNFISLPFDICGSEKSFDIVEDISYAVYRNINDRVTYQKVSMVNHLILKSLIDEGIEKTFELIGYENLSINCKSDLIKKL